MIIIDRVFTDNSIIKIRSRNLIILDNSNRCFGDPAFSKDFAKPAVHMREQVENPSTQTVGVRVLLPVYDHKRQSQSIFFLSDID